MTRDARGRGSRRRFAVRAGATSFVVLSLLVFLIGWGLTMADGQYEATSLVERVVVGLFGGALAVALATPITIVLSLAVAAGASFHLRRSASRAGGHRLSGERR